MFAREVYAAAEAAYEHSKRVAERAVFKLPDPTDRYLMSYFATAIELTGGCLALAREGQLVGIPILARSLLEAWVDFVCLAADGAYVEYIEAAHDKEWAKVIDAAMADGNRYLAKLGAEASVRVEREKIGERSAARLAHGIRPLMAIQRFRRAEKADLYYSVYNFLCSEAHNDARALISRHIALDRNGEPCLTIYKADLPYIETSLLQTHDVLADITERVCQRFQVAEPDRTTVQEAFEVARRVIESRRC